MVFYPNIDGIMMYYIQESPLNGVGLFYAPGPSLDSTPAGFICHFPAGNQTGKSWKALHLSMLFPFILTFSMFY